MILKTDNYSFWCKCNKISKRHYVYYIGNTDGKPIPCISISVDKFDQWYMTIQDLEYYPTCSFEPMERGKGTIEMVQGAIKAICKKHPKIRVIAFQDCSYWTTQNKEKISLPEFRLLAKGKTWYEKHFGATPSDNRIQGLVERYKNIRKKKVKDTKLNNVYNGYSELTIANLLKVLVEINELTEQGFKEILRSLYLDVIAHNAWHIPVASTESFIFQGRFLESDDQYGGYHMYEPTTYKFNIWR